MVRDRRLYLAPNYWNGISQSHPITRKYHGTALGNFWQIYDNRGRTAQYYSKDRWLKVADFVGKKIYQDDKYFKRMARKMLVAEKLARATIRKLKKINFKKLNFKELTENAENIFRVWLNYDMVNVPLWFWGGDRFQKLVENSFNMSRGEFLILATPDIKTWASQMELDFLKYARLIKRGRYNLEETAGNMMEKYACLPFGYDGPEYWDKNYFINRLATLIKKYSPEIDKELHNLLDQDRQNRKKKSQIIKKYKLNENQIYLLDKVNKLAVWTDQRKELEFQLHYCYAQIISELGRRYKIPCKNLKYLFITELRKIETARKEILNITNQRINHGFLLEFAKGEVKISSGRDKEKILKDISAQEKNITEIRGIVASRGPVDKYTAKVKILLSSREAVKIRKGDFLVATMTTPDYIIAMCKAVGFIADEGGVTCHAAIVGREMNKPCIIGTKIATKVLRDGQLVEVDVERGIVKILKKK